jgi:hypothetical protein
LWNAAIGEGNDWARITTGNSGTNNGSFALDILPNTGNVARTAILNVSSANAGTNAVSITISQSANAPVLLVTPMTQTTGFLNSTVSFDVTNAGGGSLNWTAELTDGANWAHLITGSAGINNGTITFSIDENPNNQVREALIRVTALNDQNNPQVLRIFQEANKPVLTINRTSQKVASSGGTVEFLVANSGGGIVEWTATLESGTEWARIYNGSMGSNNGVIALEINPNEGEQRITTVTVRADDGTGNQITLTVHQVEKVAELQVGPEVQTIGAEGGSVYFNVSRKGVGTVTWTTEVAGDASWIHILTGATGTNDGMISVKAEANEGSPRRATLTVTPSNATDRPVTLTIMQDISNGIKILGNQTEFTVYPNPVDNQCTVWIDGYDGKTRKLEVFNMTGQVETFESISQERTTLNLSGLAQGIYLFRLTADGQVVSQRRVVKN